MTRDNDSLVTVLAIEGKTVTKLDRDMTAEGVMASPDGRHAVVVVHNGTGKPLNDPMRGKAEVKLLRVEDGRVRVVGAAGAGDWVQGMGFSRDGRTLLIGNMADRTIGVYRIGDGTIADTGQRIAVSGGPAAIGTAALARSAAP